MTILDPIFPRLRMRYLIDFHLRTFSTLPVPSYRPNATALYYRVVSGIEWTKATASPSTPLYKLPVEWFFPHPCASQVVFGEKLLGRQIPSTGIERVGGLTIATVPMRVVVD